jgi:hypothetical protein
MALIRFEQLHPFSNMLALQDELANYEARPRRCARGK